MTVDLASGVASGMGADRLYGIENVWTGGGSDILTGDSSANTFYIGLASADAAKDDQVFGRGGVDTLSFDTYPCRGCLTYSGDPVKAEFDADVSIDLTFGLGSWGAGNFLVSSIENVIADNGNDTLVGNEGPNMLLGGSGNDWIDGGSGNDVVSGGFRFFGEVFDTDGDDTLSGREGDDRLDGGGGMNSNDGGDGNDTCINPEPSAGALNCEAP
jgi:Ca2+-binding RTX toxin-like protein